jgi:hypothetical protein
VAGQIENLNIAFPKRLAVKHFFHRHRPDVYRAGFVQVENHLL